MRPLSKVALGASLASVVTTGGLILGGVFATTATLVATDPFAPAAGADALTRFDSCAALLDWYVGQGVKDVGPYGWNGPIMYAEDAVKGIAPAAPGPLSSGAGSSASAEGSANGSTTDSQASSATGTNTQEADVDEPDVAKTDGRRVVRLVDQRVVVIDDVTGATAREVGRISLPIDSYGGELLLVGDHVLVSEAGYSGGPIRVDGPMNGAGVAVPDAASTPMPGRMPAMLAGGGARIIDIDISDPAHPRIAHDDTYTGQQVSLRQYGDVVRVVTTTDRPQLRWANPGRHVSVAEALRRNRALVRATTITDWLPARIDNLAGSARTPLLGCQDVYHPASWSGAETTAVTTYDVRDPGHRTSVGVTADGQVVYSSTDRLYVASNRQDAVVQPGCPDCMRPYRPQATRTQLHAFALDGTTTRYVGSGHVAGTVRDRWSLDEHGGRLRVAWTRSDGNGVTRNGITVLAERAGALVATGSIGRLGIDQTIQSVRWFDNLAVLVTFRQMDPLYTVDLTDQDHPREVGRLELPGYSGYLHPIGGDLLLGLGVDATDQGQSLGGQAAVFDISDLTHPARLSKQGFGEQSSLPAIDDPRGFTWLPDRRTALVAVTSWTSDRARLVALHVTAGGTLQARDLATNVGWNARTLPLADGRVAVVDEGVRVLDVG